MSDKRPRALVIGGSLGGLFAASLLHRAGCCVELFERMPERLAGRGSGIVTQDVLFRVLERCGVSVDPSIGVAIDGRIALSTAGEQIARRPLRQVLTAWGRLYAGLGETFPASRCHYGMSLERVDPLGDRVVAHFANGGVAEGDLLIAADGLWSTVRAQLLPGAQPRYAGYVAWRGLAPEAELSPAAHAALFEHMAFCLTAEEQMLGYPVAGPTLSTVPGERGYNFVWYRPVPEGETLARLCTDVNGHVHQGAIPPALVRRDAIEEARRDAEATLAPQLAEVVRKSLQPYYQPIYELESPQTAFGRIAVLGDAAFVARPHCGAGVAKAAGDALALAEAIERHDGRVEDALADYQVLRARESLRITRHARELGRHLESVTRPELRSPESARHHTPEAALAEIAMPLESIPG